LPEQANLIALFTQQVQRTPLAPALLFGSEQMNYQQLHVRSNQLAHFLQLQGVIPQTHVGVCLPTCLEQIIALLAILKAGGAYLPLDPNLPQKRIAFMLRHAQAHLLLTHSTLVDSLAVIGLPTLCLDQQQDLLTRQNCADLALPVLPRLAYILYTSGSTGQPKAVMGTHCGIVNRLCWMWQTYPFSEQEVCCLKTSPSFVDAVAELFTPLLAGVATVLVPDEVRNDPQYLLQFLATHQRHQRSKHQLISPQWIMRAGPLFSSHANRKH
jgi:non-ribosomal peptide synthetase component F